MRQFPYLQLRDLFHKEIKIKLSVEIKEAVAVLIEAYKQTPSKIVTKLYKGLQKRNGQNSFYIKSKWELEMSIRLAEHEWLTQQASTNSQNWHLFGWKNLSRFFLTPHITGKYLDTKQYCWRQCGHGDAAHTHIFWPCVKIQPFWDEVNETLGKILHYIIQRDPQIMYLGVIPEKVIEQGDVYLF